MKKLLLPTVGMAWLLCLGCTTPTYIRVVEQKGVTTPYTNILTIYLDENCNFSLADTTGYNICLKSLFEDSSRTAMRKRMETRIAERLSTKGTAVYKSADLLNFETGGSYAYFIQLIKKLRIDGFLLIQRSNHLEEQVNNPGMGASAGVPVGPGVSAGVAVNIPKTYYDASFDCMIIDSKSLDSPIWKAQVETKKADTKRELQEHVAILLSKTLMSEGYIVH
jgi:hypothetical protein